jgi:calpain
MSSPNKQAHFVPFLDQKYEDIQRECLARKSLFIDKRFPPEQTFLNGDQIKKNIIWRRPYDVTDTPKFFVKTPHRRDPGQGELSDCWFIVAVANITVHKQIFERVVPLNQTFDKHNGYTGLFHFRFWQFGLWYDVVIDDYLPFNKKTIQPWCSWNRQEPNEFWVSLIEKAYAKLNGGYRNLIGGAPIEAFTDLTAGVEQRFKLNQSIKERKQFFHFIIDSLKHSCLMACSINPKNDGSDLEEIKPNGLVVGHSYSITAARYLRFKKQLLRMIRLRNPWANEIEWAGAWHDRDIKWNHLDSDEKRRMSWQDSEDGEVEKSFILKINLEEAFSLSMYYRNLPSVIAVLDDLSRFFY